MDLLEQMHRTSFLGAEFITWLWFRSDHDEGIFELDPEFGPFELWFEDKLVVGSATVNAQENFFKGGHPSSSLEARTALRLGKLAYEAKLRIVRGAQEWSFLFKAENLSASGTKLPAILSKEEDDRFYERMFLIEQLEQMLKGLFSVFLKLRLSPEWEAQELPAIRAWVAVAEERPSAAELPKCRLPIQRIPSVEAPRAEEVPEPSLEEPTPPEIQEEEPTGLSLGALTGGG